MKLVRAAAGPTNNDRLGRLSGRGNCRYHRFRGSNYETRDDYDHAGERKLTSEWQYKREGETE